MRLPRVWLMAWWSIAAVSTLVFVLGLAARRNTAFAIGPGEHEKAQAQVRYASASREYMVTKGYYDQGRITPARYFAALRKLMAARLDLCATKDEQSVVVKGALAIASQEIAREELDLVGSRPYTQDPSLEYAKGFLIECGDRLNRLSGSR